MARSLGMTRRQVLQGCAAAAGVWAVRGLAEEAAAGRLTDFSHAQVEVRNGLAEAQARGTLDVLMGLNDDDLLRPYRLMSGQAAPGADLGGWYTYAPDFNWHIPQKTGLAPGSTLGQWMSALARAYAHSGDAAVQAKVIALERMLGQWLAAGGAGGFFEKTRFPAYTYEKLVCGLVDAAEFAGDRDALLTLARLTDVVEPHLPSKAVVRGVRWRAEMDESYTWDESYTLPENLYRAYAVSGDGRYRRLARQYLMDAEYFEPLSRGENVFAGKHAYSHVNALNSAMQAYRVDGSEMHLQATRNGLAMLEAQSYATGGWGPGEALSGAGSDALYASLTQSHESFETPCGAWAMMKLTQSLLEVTRDGHYGDVLERVLWNTVLGVLPLRADGAAFYYQDVSFHAHKTYGVHVWPCCSGTLGQVAADYGVKSYLRGPGAVWVNQYLASALRWDEGGVRVALEQRAPKGAAAYPLGDAVELHVQCARPVHFAMKLRIPAWCAAPELRVNGRTVPVETVLGFATVQRMWRDGDVVVLRLPMQLRLEPVAAAHPDVVALLHGPLVLMALSNDAPKVTREQLLAARRAGAMEWVVKTDVGALPMVPYIAVGDAEYTAYLAV